MKIKKNKLPKWFEGKLYPKGGEVINPFSGDSYKLNAIELSLYEFIIGSQLVFGQSEATEKQIKDFQKALDWFRVNNPDAYDTLLY